MKPVIVAMTLALALTAYWIVEYAECFIDPGTDSCTGCTDDCLDPATHEEERP